MATAAESDREARVMEVLLRSWVTAIRRGSISGWSKGAGRGRRGHAVRRRLRPGSRLGLCRRATGGRRDRTERIIDEEIARLAQEGPTPIEITKARNQALAGFWHGLETISGKAQALGRYEVFYGDYRKLSARGRVRERHRGGREGTRLRRCCAARTARSACSSPRPNQAPSHGGGAK